MQVVEEIDRYFKFYSSEVSQQLSDLLSSQLAHSLTYKQQSQETLVNLRSSLQLLMDQQSGWHPFHDQFTCFLTVFSSLEERVRGEVESVSETERQLREAAESLERCELVWSRLQERLISESVGQFGRRSQKMKAESREIESLQSQLEEVKVTCFVRMLQFARELSEVSIRNKFQQKLDIETNKEYGKKSSEINEYLDENIRIEADIAKHHSNISKHQDKLELFLNHALASFFKAEQEKLKALQTISWSLLRQPPQDGNCTLVPFRADIPKKKQEERKLSSLDHMRKAADLCLHPHLIKQTIVQHRRTFANQVGEVECSGVRSDNAMTVQIPQTFEELTIMDILHKQVAQMNEYFRRCGEISAKDIEYYLSSLEHSFKDEEQRQLVVFFLYQQINGKEYLLLSQDQLAFTLSLFNLCLKKCMGRFDSKTVIKLLLVSLKMKSLKDGREFHELIDCSLIRDNFEFWESTFVETVYEYTQIMVNFYEAQLSKLKKSNVQNKKNFWSFFDPLFHLFKPHCTTQKQSSIRELFPEILKNVFTIYLSLMQVLRIPEPVQERLRRQISAAIRSLQLPLQEEQDLEAKLGKLKEREQESMKVLLRSKLVFERSLSSIIGPADEEEEEREIATLSESIREWEEGGSE